MLLHAVSLSAFPRQRTVETIQSASNSATTDPSVAFKPWDDEQEANYGVAPGLSDLSIVDVDKGIADRAALDAWMERNGLPETFTVQTGRAGEFGAHLLPWVPSRQLRMSSMVSREKFVATVLTSSAPGHIHPSGKKLPRSSMTRTSHHSPPIAFPLKRSTRSKTRLEPMNSPQSASVTDG